MLIGTTGLNSIAASVSKTGFNISKRLSNQARNNLSVSNFGSETKIGTSKFQKDNNKAHDLDNQATSKKMSEVTQAEESFNHKLSYTKNATLENIRMGMLDILV